MQKIDAKNIDLFYEILDEACMLLYDELKISYLEALIRVGNDIVFEIDDSRISLETFEKLQEIYKRLTNKIFLNEEIRLAFELLMVKAFKHSDINYEIITPDTINYLVSVISSDLMGDKDIKILDPMLGSGNMLEAIANNFPRKVELIGIENNSNLVKLAEINSNLEGNIIDIYFQDTLNSINNIVDLIVCDFDNSNINTKTNSYLNNNGITYLPYLVIEKHLENLKDKGYLVLVIDNDFFEQKGSNIFHEYILNKMTFMALITLPPSLTKEGHPGKSILIGKKEVLSDYRIEIMNIEDFDRNKLDNVFIKLSGIIENIKNN